MNEKDFFISEGPLLITSLKEALAASGQLPLCVRGTSMQPVIRDNDTVLLEKCDARAIRQGDIVLFDIENIRLVAHRVIRTKDEGQKKICITKGDRLLGFDQPFGSERIIGAVHSVLRNKEPLILDRVLWYRVLKAFNVRAPHCSIIVNYIILTLKRAAQNISLKKRR